MRICQEIWTDSTAFLEFFVRKKLFPKNGNSFSLSVVTAGCEYPFGGTVLGKRPGAFQSGETGALHGADTAPDGYGKYGTVPRNRWSRCAWHGINPVG